jgi:hypothetical protein
VPTHYARPTRGVEVPLEFVAVWEDQWFLMRAREHEQGRCALGCVKVSEDRLIGDLRLSGVEGADADRVAARPPR